MRIKSVPLSSLQMATGHLGVAQAPSAEHYQGIKHKLEYRSQIYVHNRFSVSLYPFITVVTELSHHGPRVWLARSPRTKFRTTR